MPSPEAEQEFVERYWGIALWVARRRVSVAGGRLDLHDAQSDAALGLYRAARTYDPTRGRTEASWARYCAERDIAEGIRNRARRLIPVPVEFGEDDIVEDSHAVAVIDRVDVARALVSLTPRHRYVVVARYRDGLTWRAIGEHLGVTEGRAHQLGTEARQCLTRSLAVPNERCPAPFTGCGALRCLRRRSRGPSVPQARFEPRQGALGRRSIRRRSSGRGRASCGTAPTQRAPTPRPRRPALPSRAQAATARDQ